MIKKITQSAAYICASCGKVIYRDFEIFGFTSMLPHRINCGKHCKGSAVISEFGEKYLISFMCPFCGETHEYTVKKTMFWKTDLFSFDCPFAEMSVFFIGDKKKIKNEIQLQTNEIRYMEDTDEIATIASEILNSDMFAIIENVREKYIDGKISCHCGSNDVTVNIGEDSIVICCNDCSSVKIMKANQREYINLINTDNIII